MKQAEVEVFNPGAIRSEKSEGIESALQHWNTRRAADRITEIGYRHATIMAQAARLEALLRAIEDIQLAGRDLSDAHILDVGAAQGYGLTPFMTAAFREDQLHGVEMFTSRIEEGKKLHPSLDIVHGDGSKMDMFDDGAFDIVCEQFCFCHVPDFDLQGKIAREMLRVCKPGGYIFVHDWRMTMERIKIYGPSFGRIARMFEGASLVRRYRSQLFPPVGRMLSRFAPSLYFPARRIPFLCGSWLTVLRKEGRQGD